MTISLSERDYKKLVSYARRSGVTRPLAAKRLIRERLAAITAEKQTEVSKNQLGLFDAIQIDMFGK